mmetsp:Transcript_7331/g.23884  ORF Transcript_7331/g.23884 Transcript_7331/m.23884 type:complete len:402 (-) Transcript_7331:2632-3837(-)
MQPATSCRQPEASSILAILTKTRLTVLRRASNNLSNAFTARQRRKGRYSCTRSMRLETLASSSRCAPAPSAETRHWRHAVKSLLDNTRPTTRRKSCACLRFAFTFKRHAAHAAERNAWYMRTAAFFATAIWCTKTASALRHAAHPRARFNFFMRPTQRSTTARFDAICACALRHCRSAAASCLDRIRPKTRRVHKSRFCSAACALEDAFHVRSAAESFAWRTTRKHLSATNCCEAQSFHLFHASETFAFAKRKIVRVMTATVTSRSRPLCSSTENAAASWARSMRLTVRTITCRRCRTAASPKRQQRHAAKSARYNTRRKTRVTRLLTFRCFESTAFQRRQAAASSAFCMPKTVRFIALRCPKTKVHRFTSARQATQPAERCRFSMRKIEPRSLALVNSRP